MILGQNGQPVEPVMEATITLRLQSQKLDIKVTNVSGPGELLKLLHSAIEALFQKQIAQAQAASGIVVPQLVPPKDL